jgi:hypothetical protein
MARAQDEVFLHVAMDLECLARRLPKWCAALQSILFNGGDIAQHAEKEEDAQDKI